MIGSFLLCFVIVVTPPRLFLERSIMVGVASGGREHNLEITATKPFERAPTQMAVLAPSSHEGSGRDLEKAELAQVLTGEALQVKEEPQGGKARGLAKHSARLRGRSALRVDGTLLQNAPTHMTVGLQMFV